MKKSRFMLLLLMAYGVVGLLISSPAKAVDWRFPVGFSYVSGLGDVFDIYKENLEAEGFIVEDSFQIPVGLSFHPYVQWENGARMGIGIGPSMLILGGDRTHFGLPLNINGGYTLFPASNTSPYIRAGVAYHASSGDYLENVSPGFFGAAGIEFFRKKAAGFGLEIAYDSSEIELEKKLSRTVSRIEKVKPAGLILSLFAIF